MKGGHNDTRFHPGHTNRINAVTLKVVNDNSEQFEQNVAPIHELLESIGAAVTWNDHIPDPDNPTQPRQIDITIKRDNAQVP